MKAMFLRNVEPPPSYTALRPIGPFLSQTDIITDMFHILIKRKTFPIHAFHHRPNMTYALPFE
jgi:hypothetical protein